MDSANVNNKKVRKSQEYLDSLQNIEVLGILSDNIEYYRKKKNISKFTLSNEAQIGKNTITEILNKQYLPGIDVLDRISKVLGIPLSLLFISSNNNSEQAVKIIKLISERFSLDINVHQE